LVLSLIGDTKESDTVFSRVGGGPSHVEILCNTPFADLRAQTDRASLEFRYFVHSMNTAGEADRNVSQ
jgi:hypothetical protein